MQIQLNDCSALRPDRRAIQKLIEELAAVDSNTAREMTANFLDGTPLELEIDSSPTGSALRSIRKLKIDYDLIE